MSSNSDYSYNPPNTGVGGGAPIEGSESKDSGLPTKKMGETEHKTVTVADQIGISAKGSEGKGTVIKPQKKSLKASTESAGAIDKKEAVDSVRKDLSKGKFSSEESTDTLDPADSSISDVASELEDVEGGAVDKPPPADPQGSTTAINIDQSIQEKFLGAIQEMLEGVDATDIREMVQSVRTEVADAKKEFRARSAKDEALDTKIEKQERHIESLQGSVKGMSGQTGKGGEKTRALRQEAKRQIAHAEQKIAKLEAKRSPFAPDRKFSAQVQQLMRTGNLKPISGGKSGVYFLCDHEGVPKYVVKPYDEDMLTLNNPKGFATPFREVDNACRPKAGVAMYSAAKNEMMASTIARELGVSRCTVKAQMMILTSDIFHDITDDISADEQEIADTYGAADKEKLCVVQEFIPGCTEVGDLLLDGSKLSQKEFMEMDWEERTALERDILPKDIDQEMYEEGIILALVCGEADGNAGNYMVSDTVDPNTKKRPIKKIDNAASFTDDNSSIRSGAEWLLNCCERPLTDKGKALIRGLDPNRIESLMKEQGYSDQSIEAMHERVYVMKMYLDHLPKDCTVEDWVVDVEAHFQPGEESYEEAAVEEEGVETQEEIL